MFIAMINIIIVKFYYLQIQEYEILRDRSLFSGGGRGGYYFWGEGHNFFQAFKGRVKIFFKPSGGGSYFFFNGWTLFRTAHHMILFLHSIIILRELIGSEKGIFFRLALRARHDYALLNHTSSKRTWHWWFKKKERFFPARAPRSPWLCSA